MSGATKKRVIKEIRVDIKKCTGCRSCEVACSAFHADPRFSSTNPSRARIRVFMDEINDLYVPVRAGGYIQAECNGRNMYVIEGREYSECIFCPASCPSRGFFKEPDSGLPLKCDMCEDLPPLDAPMCVQACKFEALTYHTREEEQREEEEKYDEIQTAYNMLIKRHGKSRVLELFTRFAGEK
jgi:benzoyl-CoA reductase subunit BamC